MGPPGHEAFSNVLIYNILKNDESKKRVKIRVKCLTLKIRGLSKL